MNCYSNITAVVLLLKRNLKILQSLLSNSFTLLPHLPCEVTIFFFVAMQNASLRALKDASLNESPKLKVTLVCILETYRNRFKGK